MERTPTALDYAFVLGATWLLARAGASLLGLSPVVGTVVTIVGAVVATTGKGPELLQEGARLLFAPASALHGALSGIEAPSWLLGAPAEDAEEEVVDAAA